MDCDLLLKSCASSYSLLRDTQDCYVVTWENYNAISSVKTTVIDSDQTTSDGFDNYEGWMKKSNQDCKICSKPYQYLVFIEDFIR